MGFLPAGTKEGAAAVWGSGAAGVALGDHSALAGAPLPEPPASRRTAPDILRIPGPGLSESHGVFQLPEVNFLLFPSRLSFPLLLNFAQHNDFEGTVFNCLYGAKINIKFMPQRSRALSIYQQRAYFKIM